VLANELRCALYPMANRPAIVSFIAGLGGREVSTDNVIDITSKVLEAASAGETQDTHWIGLRE
jgi:pyruvate ferredoxin oxidoreductase alpha subunit